MKRSFFVAALVCLSASLLAQKESELSPYKNEHLDSLLHVYPKLNQPFVAPIPKGLDTLFTNPTEKNNRFETTHPGATVINKTARGTVYSMAPDNMAVLVPDMNQVERMPNGRQSLSNAPPDRMPNPYYPRFRGNSKK